MKKIDAEFMKSILDKLNLSSEIREVENDFFILEVLDSEIARRVMKGNADLMEIKNGMLSYSAAM